MTALPAASAWTGSAVTEGGFKAAQNDLRTYLAELLGTDGLAATALATLGALLGAGVTAKSTSYTVLMTDRGKLLSCSGTITITLPDAATAGAGFAIVVKNGGTGTVTIDGNLTETIDGSETVALGASGTALLVCDGSGWITLGRVSDTKTFGDNSASLATTAFVQAAAAAVDTTPSTTDVLNATAGATAGAVGTYGFLFYAGAIGVGTTVSGSSLDWASVYTHSTASPGGTWRSMGHCSYDGSNHSTGTTVWLRIA